MTSTPGRWAAGTQDSADVPRTGHPLADRVAQDVMTSRVRTVAGSATLRDAMEVMRAGGVRHLPVTSPDGRFLGLVDDRLMTTAMSGDGWPDALDQHVELVMMRYVAQVGPLTPMPRVAHLLGSSRSDAVVVVDEGERLLGILTASDVVSEVARAGSS